MPSRSSVNSVVGASLTSLADSGSFIRKLDARRATLDVQVRRTSLAAKALPAADATSPSSASDALKQLFHTDGHAHRQAVAEMRRFLWGRQRGCVIDPRYSQFIVIWDLVTAVGCLFTALFTPYEVAFMEAASSPFDPVFLINQLMTIVFVLDLLLNFFLMYRASPSKGQALGLWVSNPSRIVRHYLSTWFIVDLVSVGVAGFDFLPICWSDAATCAAEAASEAGAGSISNLRGFRALRALRLLKLARVVRASRVLKKWETHITINYAALEMIKAFLITFLWCHWLACVWGLQAAFARSALDTWRAYPASPPASPPAPTRSPTPHPAVLLLPLPLPLLLLRLPLLLLQRPPLPATYKPHHSSCVASLFGGGDGVGSEGGGSSGTPWTRRRHEWMSGQGAREGACWTRRHLRRGRSEHAPQC